jgi:hypothetical protein
MIDVLPAWLSTLREDRTLSGELGIRWLDEQERRTLHTSATRVLAGLVGDNGWKERGLTRFGRCIPLAVGPERKSRVKNAASSTAIFFDPERPADVSLSLAVSMSPLTWPEAPATAEGIRALFERYLIADATPPAALPRRFRFAVQFGDIDRERLEETLTNRQPMLDDATWYSAHADDPWLGQADMWGAELVAYLRDVRREHPGRFPSVSFRTQFSKSVVRLEQHPFGVWAVEMRYVPSPDAAAVRWVNEMFRARFSEDMPVDLVLVSLSLLQGGQTFENDLEEREAQGIVDSSGVAVRLALAPGEPEATARFRGWIERCEADPAMLGFLAEAASRYRDQEALLEIALRTAGSELSETILDRMKPSHGASDSAPPDDVNDDEDDADDAEHV